VSPRIADVCLVANLQSHGPTYVGDAIGDVFDPSSGMLLSARIIITAGMGNSASPYHVLHGPVPIPELNDENKFECYFFVSQLQQKPIPTSSFSTGKGSYIICVIIPSKNKKEFRAFEGQIEVILRDNSSDIDFSDSVSGELTSEVKDRLQNKLAKIFNDINEVLDVAPLYEGGSLFDVGLIASLPDHISRIAKKLILHPKGIQENEIEDHKVLKTLYQAGLISKDIRNGEIWIIPR
jgi:hypothetical protein